MIEKVHGYKILINNSRKMFAVNLEQRYIEFNHKFKEALSEQQILFCVRWARNAKRLGILNLTDIDIKTINWYKFKFGSLAFNQFLQVIHNFDVKMYNRLIFGEFSETQKNKLWLKVKSFFAKKR